MDAKALRATVTQAAAPVGLSGPVTALWYAAKDDWQKAHAIVMDDDSREAAWVHAYLHRVEGDEGNAGYWYRRAGRPHETRPLVEEWAAIADALLAKEVP